MTLDDAYESVKAFKAGPLKKRLAHLEQEMQQKVGAALSTLLPDLGVGSSVLDAALTLKQATGQIDEVVHAVGILLALPHILAEDEVVHYLSLGAGNTGKRFDLETDRRVAEFKFIQWQGKSDVVRQNALFKDFFRLAEHETNKKRYLYVVDSTHPRRFLRSGRDLESVMSRDVALLADFRRRYGDQYRVVREYYDAMQDKVHVVDVVAIIPRLAEVAPTVEPEDEASG